MSRVAVVGGGISGLTAAWRLVHAGADVVLLEGRDRTGGVLHRGEVGPAGPVVDLGAESLLARRPEAIDLAAEVGLGDELEAPATTTAAICSRGRLHVMPKGHLMGVPGRAEALSGLLDEDETERLATALEQPGRPIDGDVSVAQWLGERLGRPVVDRLVEPLLGGVYAGRVERLSARATLPALASALTDGRALGPDVRARVASSTAAGPVFTGIRGGVARLAEAVRDAVVSAGGEVRTEALVTTLARDGAGWRVGGLPAAVDAVVLAVPAPAAARLLHQVPETRSAAAALEQVEVASMALVSATLPTGTLARAGESLSGVLIPAVERRLVKAMTFTSAKWGWAAGGPDLLRMSVGRAGEAAALRRSDRDLSRAALADAAAVLGLDLPATGVRVSRWGGGLPQYDVGHLTRIAAACDAIARVPGLHVCGSAFGGVGVPACIAGATASARAVTEGLGRA